MQIRLDVVEDWLGDEDLDVTLPSDASDGAIGIEDWLGDEVSDVILLDDA